MSATTKSELLDIVARRGNMPGVEGLQTAYARYFQNGEAQAQASWQLGLSRWNYAEMAKQSEQISSPLPLLPQHQLFSADAPESVSMRIVQAPAEFMLPLKQDRRLSPSFKIKVKVQFRGQVSLPIHLRAHMITQVDMDMVQSWQPDKGSVGEADKKNILELKGSTSITHRFEASMMAQSNANSGNGGNIFSDISMQDAPINDTDVGVSWSKEPIETWAPGNYQSTSISPSLLLQSWVGEGVGTAVSKRASVGTGDGHRPSFGLPLDQTFGLKNLYHSGSSAVDCDISNGASLPVETATKVNRTVDGPQVPGVAWVPSTASFLDSLELNQMMQQMCQHQQQQSQISQLYNSSNCKSGFQISTAKASLQQQHQVSGYELSTIEHDFEFCNLELVRPTRMNKVYMIFSADILDIDTLFVVYHVPTIGICRAEQREKACQKLGVPMPIPIPAPDSPRTDVPETSMLIQGNRKREAVQQGASIESMHPYRGGADMSSFHQHLPSGRVSISNDVVAAVPYSRLALRDWIVEAYEMTGLTRRLTELDLQALLSQAGFPFAEIPVSNQAFTTKVSRGQWVEFQEHFQEVLTLLRQISSVWNLEDPCVISGFDMDRVGTIQALSTEPTGTFICRFSMSQPGCLVLACKIASQRSQDDSDNLIHAILKISDLRERRVDTWIRDFSGATHVLDVYHHKRVDKRKVFTSNYTNLRGLSNHDMGFDSIVA